MPEPKQGDWDSSVSQLPEPGFGAAWSPFTEGMFSALGPVWAGDRQVSVNRTDTRSPEGWWEKRYTWLRLPTPSDQSGYLLESLTVRLAPAGEDDSPAVEGKPLANSATVTEVVGWEPAYRRDPPVFEALVPARRIFLDGYLGLGDDFWSHFGGLESAPGTEAEFAGADGATVFLTVEDVPLRVGFVARRYTLTRGDGVGR